MSRLKFRLPFFEQASAKRDTSSWWTNLKPAIIDKNIEVVGLVSDRAKALVKLAKHEYLSTLSMPDLFHFMQYLSKTVGARLGNQFKKAQKRLDATNCLSYNYEAIKEEVRTKKQNLENYTAYREKINQLVHPFNEEDELVEQEAINTNIRELVTNIEELAFEAKIVVCEEASNKILNQIPAIAGGINHWQNYLKTAVEKLGLNELTKKWLLQILLPYLYWEFHLTKVSRRKRDKSLKAYCQKRVKTAKLRLSNAEKDFNIEAQQKQYLTDWATKIVSTFHRSSSRVEGRNGYLAFINHATKGIPARRKKALTIIHNFDIRRADGTTAAQRLFDREFPSLFEFIVEDIKGLPSARARKMKTCITC